MYTPVDPSFTIWKWGLRGSKLYRHVFVMIFTVKKVNNLTSTNAIGIIVLQSGVPVHQVVEQRPARLLLQWLGAQVLLVRACKFDCWYDFQFMHMPITSNLIPERVLFIGYVKGKDSRHRCSQSCIRVFDAPSYLWYGSKGQGHRILHTTRWRGRCWWTIFQCGRNIQKWGRQIYYFLF